MKRSLIILFSVLLLSSFCYAEQQPVNASSGQVKLAENNKTNIPGKSVKPKLKKTGKKIQKKNKSIKK